ncbi:MAG: hypothetical protein Q7U00_08420 [Sulfurimonas sp.]|nr:hypothetical protein [Sulfurimonas sp.]
MDEKISNEMSVMMYDDLATLAEGVISTAIESGKKITPIYFYDAYRALDELDEALYDVVVYISGNLDFEYPKNQTFTFASPEAKWFYIISEHLEKATRKTKAFLLELGSIYCMDERSRFVMSPICRFASDYFPMIRNDYQGDKIEEGSLLFTRTVLLMPELDQPIDTTNELKLSIIRENIRELSVRERLRVEGVKSLLRLDVIRKKMEDYLMENISIKELFPRRVVL